MMILQVGDIFKELEKHLISLSKAFEPAVTKFNEKNRSFRITNDLSIGDIYSEVDFNSKHLKIISPEEFETYINKLHLILECASSAHELQELTYAEFIHWCCPKFEYDDECNIVAEIDDPTFNLFVKLGSMYMQKMGELIDQIIRNNFGQHWNLLFELKSFSEIELFFEKSEKLLSDRRKICSHYYEIITRVREHFFDINEAECLPIDWEEDIRNQKNSWRTVSPGPFIIWQQPSSSDRETPLQEIIKVLESKVSIFYSKITLSESKDCFVNNMRKTIKKAKHNEQDFLLFIEDSFHCDGQEWTPRIQYNLPHIMASRFIRILIIMEESNLIRGATQEDLKKWLEYQFYGVKGFKYDNYKKQRRKAILEISRRKKRQEEANR
jgi:hypothetical protein